MTLFVTPVMYSLLNSRHDKKLAKKIERESAEKISAAAAVFTGK
jgi:hypothetical protein